ncbi:MAG: hypothetical protein ACE149_16700 [Armatimonadota bacterium]
MGRSVAHTGRIAIAVGLVVLASASGYAYVPPNPIELTKKFHALEALARDGGPEARQELIRLALYGIDAPENERFQVRRMAFRMLSRVGQAADLSAVPALDPSDQLWHCWRVAETAILARERGEVKSVTADALLRLYDALLVAPVDETASARTLRQCHAVIVGVEIGFQIADQALPADRFPPEIIDRSSEVAFARLRAQYDQVTSASDLVKQLEEQLGSEDQRLRDAAAALIIERGGPALPAALGLLRDSLPSSSPPPWAPQTRTFRACLDILAGIGGDPALTALTELAADPRPYVSACAAASKEWVQSGVEYQPLYRDTFLNPYVDP